MCQVGEKDILGLPPAAGHGKHRAVMKTEYPFSADKQEQNRIASGREAGEAEVAAALADALAAGQVENVVIFFRHEPEACAFVGALLTDERLAVQLGLAVLFEELAVLEPLLAAEAVPFLTQQLHNPVDRIRGDAASILGTIRSPEALAALVPLEHDPSSQVAEIVHDILGHHGD